MTQSLSIRWLLYTHYIPITGSRREGGGAGGEEERGGWGKGRGRGGGTEETSSCMRMGDAGGEGEGGRGGIGCLPILHRAFQGKPCEYCRNAGHCVLMTTSLLNQ